MSSLVSKMKEVGKFLENFLLNFSHWGIKLSVECLFGKNFMHSNFKFRENVEGKKRKGKIGDDECGRGKLFAFSYNLSTSNPLLLHLTLHSPSIRETTLTNHRLIVTTFLIKTFLLYITFFCL